MAAPRSRSKERKRGLSPEGSFTGPTMESPDGAYQPRPNDKDLSYLA